MVEGFNLIDNDLKKAVFKGLHEYVEKIKEVKYRYVYNMIKKFVNAWKECVEIRKIKKKGMLLLKQRLKVTIVNKAMKGWSNYVKTLIVLREVKRKVEDNHKYYLIQQAINKWKHNYKEHIHFQREEENAIVQWETYNKLKAMKAWILYLNSKYLKLQHYEEYKQLYYKKLLHKTINQWSIYITNMHSKAPIFNIKKYIRQYFIIWRDNYLNSVKTKCMYGQSLKRRLICLLKENKQYEHKKAKVCNLFEWNMKKKVMNTLVRRKVRKIAERDKKKKREDEIKKKVLMVLKNNCKKEQIHRLNIAASIQFYQESYGKKVMKALVKHKVKNAKLRNSVITFALNKLTKVFTHFNLQIKQHKMLKEAYDSVFIKHHIGSKRLILNYWYNSLKLLNTLNNKADIYVNRRLKRKVMKRLGKNVERKREKRNLVVSTEVKYKLLILKRVIKGMKKYMVNPELLNIKRAIKLYLKTLYTKSIRKLSIHSNQERIRRNVGRYYVLRLRRNIFKKWSKFTTLSVSRRRFFKRRVRRIAKKALFGLLIHKEQKQHNQILLLEAIKFRARILAELIFKVFKQRVELTNNLQMQVEEIIRYKNERVKGSIIEEWSVFVQRKRILEIAIQTYKSFSDEIRVKKTLNLMTKNMRTVVIIRQVRHMIRKKMLKKSILQLVKHKVLQKYLKAFNEKICSSLLIRIMTDWKSKTEENLRMKQLGNRLSQKVINKLHKKVLNSLSINKTRNKTNRNNGILINNNHIIHMAKNCIKIMKEKAMYATLRIRHTSIKRCMAFSRLKETLINQKVNKEVAFTQLELSLSQYAKTLTRKALLGIRHYLGKERLKGKYKIVQRKYVWKKYLDIWRGRYIEFSM